MNSHLVEVWLKETPRKPMTSTQMIRFYGKTKDHRPSHKDRFMAVLGEALIALGQRVKPKNIVQTAKPVYQGKK